MLSVEEARTRILAGVVPVEAEAVPLWPARGRILARDLAARLTQPPYPSSAMDGYALAAGSGAPEGASYRIVGESAAGHAFAAALQPGEAVRIFTGGVVPEGADTVVPQEEVRREGDVLHLNAPPQAGRFVRPPGLDFGQGDVALCAGRRLDPRALALAAAMNHAVLPVRRRPRIAILATGDELAVPGQDLAAGQIVMSSVYSVAALVENAGAEPLLLGCAPDAVTLQVERLEAGLAAGADVIVTLGGASVGDHDHAKAAFAALGMEAGFWQVAVRPGKPLIFGHHAGRHGLQRLLGLPGNPVSAYVCGVLFLQPLIRALLGLSPDLPRLRATLGAALPANGAREDYRRADLTRDANGGLVATAFREQDSSVQSLLARAGALIRRPIGAAPAVVGEWVDILPLEAAD